MKKIFSIAALISGIVLLFASCAKKELDTNQIPATSEVSLTAYGPRPVVRGGVLRFVGANLEQVVSVTVPGCEPITEIEVVKSGVPSEIRVTLPKDGPEVGTVILTTKSGKTLETSTPLSYIETIVLDKVTPAAAYPGDKVVLSGDYLNLIHEVIFSKNIRISEKNFVKQDRYSVEVVVPAAASTGKIGVGTVDETVTVDESVLESLNILELAFEVKTATGTVASAGPYRPGDKVTVNGVRLDLVKKVKLEGATVETVTGTAQAIQFTLPDVAKDGSVLLVMESGVEVNAGEIKTAVPVVTAVSPKPVVPGTKLTLSGSGFDLVESLEVPAAVADHSWPEFNNTDPKALLFTVPEDATGDNLVLHMKNGNTVAVEYELSLSTVAAVDPLNITAGDKVTVTGTQLQLVKSVAIGDGECEFTLDSDTQITVQTVAATKSGKVVLTLKNGSKVYSADKVEVKAAGKVQVLSMPSSASVGSEVTMEGTGFMAIESIYFGQTKITAYSERTDTKVVFTLPTSLDTGNYTPKFVLTTGEEEMCVLSMDVKGMVTTIVLFEGEHSMGLAWDGGQALILDGSAFGKVPYGASIHFEYDLEAADYHMFQFHYNSAGGWQMMSETSISGTTSYVMTPTDEQYDRIYSDGLVVFGYAWILHKVYVTYENESVEPLKLGDVMLVDWDGHGDHNGYWDQPDSWGGVSTEIVWVAEGSCYLKVTAGSTDEKWTVCCNHQANYTENVPHWIIADASEYVLKIDVMLEGDASAADMTINPVIGDTWPGGLGAGLFPATTGGKWVTVTIDAGLTGALDCSSGINGFMAANVPACLCLDNFRLSLK